MGASRTKKQFKVIIEQDEDGYLVASVPALPGCHTQAKTLPELNKRVHEAISLCLDLAKTDVQYRSRVKRFSYEPTFVGLETVEL
jgi:predicted RNase H-like HicB family nuclease